MSTNSKIGRKYPKPSGRRIVKADYPDGTGPCGRVCSCSEECKAGEFTRIDGDITFPSEMDPNYRSVGSGYFPT